MISYKNPYINIMNCVSIFQTDMLKCNEYLKQWIAFITFVYHKMLQCLVHAYGARVNHIRENKWTVPIPVHWINCDIITLHSHELDEKKKHSNKYTCLKKKKIAPVCRHKISNKKPKRTRTIVSLMRTSLQWEKYLNPFWCRMR